VSLWPLLVLIGFTLLTRRKHILAETTYFLMGLFVPIIVAFVVSATIRPLFLSRYLIICFPSFLILIVHFLTLYKKKTTYILFAILLIVLLCGLLAEALSSKNPANENFRDAAAYVSVHANQDDLFIVTASFVRYPIEFYYTGTPRLRTFPIWNRYDAGYEIPEYSDAYLEETLRGWTDRYTYMYVLMGYDQGYEQQMRLYLDNHFQKVETREFSPGLNLHVYKLRYF
jgi:4-amino-4-deoxy-L-arabinose transferase-like glycosyltransferase